MSCLICRSAAMTLTTHPAIAHALNSKIYCDARKAAILRCEQDKELDALLTSNAREAAVHLVPLGVITSDKLKPYYERYKDTFSRAVGFRPTGWTYVLLDLSYSQF